MPAVLYHYIVTQADEDEIDWLFGRTPGTALNGILRFLIIASTVGGIVKSNANISGGVGGCQAEVGTSGAMAAGGLAHLLGGNNNIITFNAAEASLEDQLGSTCDPVGGLVELPCIDRNLSAAIVAVTVAQAMAKLGTAFVSDIPFDKAVTAMQQISENMNDQYKETSTGGLALVMQDEVKARRPDLFPPTRELCTARSHMRISLSRTTC
ncbi:L-serine ammonia-lyase, iron-sulfur-dependent, subunit beta [Microvirgula aerodenitrificans]|uniref:L-serine ammonia-lyase, iron-sulfur-dependent, subunit beta n=1 Tax=Microvirgula aerodenitrificans TaxID=57480 RepID=UPI00131EFB23|nr:L-serine ammonia-lyase, iron-sulfur-dependent, subunit alpha [Microvirgula aerodenitrificans]